MNFFKFLIFIFLSFSLHAVEAKKETVQLKNKADLVKAFDIKEENLINAIKKMDEIESEIIKSTDEKKIKTLLVDLFENQSCLTYFLVSNTGDIKFDKTKKFDTSSFQPSKELEEKTNKYLSNDVELMGKMMAVVLKSNDLERDISKDCKFKLVENESYKKIKKSIEEDEKRYKEIHERAKSTHPDYQKFISDIDEQPGLMLGMSSDNLPVVPGKKMHNFLVLYDLGLSTVTDNFPGLNEKCTQEAMKIYLGRCSTKEYAMIPSIPLSKQICIKNNQDKLPVECRIKEEKKTKIAAVPLPAKAVDNSSVANLDSTPEAAPGLNVVNRFEMEENYTNYLSIIKKFESFQVRESDPSKPKESYCSNPNEDFEKTTSQMPELKTAKNNQILDYYFQNSKNNYCKFEVSVTIASKWFDEDHLKYFHNEMYALVNGNEKDRKYFSAFIGHHNNLMSGYMQNKTSALKIDLTKAQNEHAEYLLLVFYLNINRVRTEVKDQYALAYYKIYILNTYRDIRFHFGEIKFHPSFYKDNEKRIADDIIDGKFNILIDESYKFNSNNMNDTKDFFVTLPENFILNYMKHIMESKADNAIKCYFMMTVGKRLLDFDIDKILSTISNTKFGNDNCIKSRVDYIKSAKNIGTSDCSLYALPVEYNNNYHNFNYTESAYKFSKTPACMRECNSAEDCVKVQESNCNSIVVNKKYQDGISGLKRWLPSDERN